MVQTTRDAFGELEKIFAELASSGKPFLGGDKPNQADVYALTMILFGHNIYLGGLTADPAAPCQLADVGAPSLMPYVERWMERPTYVKCYRTKSTVNAPAMRNFSNMLMMAHDVMDGGKRIYTCLERLRELDVEYDGKEHPPVIVEAPAPKSPSRRGIQHRPRQAKRQRRRKKMMKKRRRRTSPWSLARGPQPIRGRLPLRSEPGPGDRKPGGKPFKAVLSAHLTAAGTPRASSSAATRPSARSPFCPYCLRISLLLIESGVEFETFLIDAGDKPDWFINAYEKAETPAMMGSPKMDDSGGRV